MPGVAADRIPDEGHAAGSVPIVLSRKKLERRPSRFAWTRTTGHWCRCTSVWEITLACNLKCQHCGSRAGKRRPDELSTEECLDVVDQLARLGTREVTLIGGEAFLVRTGPRSCGRSGPTAWPAPSRPAGEG